MEQIFEFIAYLLKSGIPLWISLVLCVLSGISLYFVKNTKKFALIEFLEKSVVVTFFATVAFAAISGLYWLWTKS